ncbi:hypothetical protein [Virgibacillus pantothenticus]|uniref:Uncharacterized protein n=1 Tax=Virgibacillus pantothenticus TaxID=1473 RepID=A0A0L0QUY3_VIRPA|nr:hypothetical protein [Virgibacillus pantothenticus]KNE22485.1 hypothetical protein AFK71_02380 [Virgibacillus pantothenticus]MED3737261.1 hypothetical protein [Virgibacillus pantothenticus]QTY16955.1 hypothetical protein KBP50_03260 [Virgibacillus pantothenticus]
MSEKQQWYNNQQLFEQINAMSKDFVGLRHEMQETRNMIKKYNGLREKIDVVEGKVKKIEAITEGKKTFAEAIRLWGGWLFALITLAVLLVDKF